MNQYRLLLLFLFSFLPGAIANSQTRTINLTLEEVIEIAKRQSPDAILARHRYRGSYWQHRTYRAEFLPGLSISGTLPDLNRSITPYTLPDGTERFIERNVVNTLASLSVRQNVGLTGGQIFMSTELQRIDNLDLDSASYRTTPVNIGFRQPLFGFNPYKWQRMIEPLRYEEAKKNYIEAMERVGSRAVNLFFDLALAQINMEIAEFNHANTDTLYQIARGRYNIGTIAENQLLQMELSHLNAGTALNEAILDLELRKFQLRSFLGYNETVDLELTITPDIPDLTVNVGKAVELAEENNPEMISFERQLIEAEREVARARSQRGFQADLFAVYGLTNSAADFGEAYSDPQISQRVQVGVEIPLLDWGLGRGRYRMAQSSQEVVRTQVEQSRTDFEQNVFLQIMRFNMQTDQLEIASKADTIAQLRYDVTRERFLIGRIDVLDLNDAQTQRDIARRGFVSALRNYWNLFYNVRRLTLYDFVNEEPLEEDFDELLL